MESKRDQILRAAWRLFESQGYHATGINQIITESGVPKGSFYHYFPKGKEGLACEAIEAIGTGMRIKIERACASTDDCFTGLACLAREIAEHLEESGYQHGGPLTTVALETATTNERLNAECRRAYEQLQQGLAERIREDGFDRQDAHELSTMIIAALEGGVMLSRTFHSREPMEHLARQIEAIRADRVPSG